MSEEGLLLGRILLVDDDPQLRRLVARDLEEAGHTCLVAADPAEARRFLRTEQVELMLCDVHMPGESGMTLLREVIAQHADVGTVMISGVDDPRFAETALGLGALGYLVKPVTPTELLIGVSNALRRLREQRGEKESAVQLEQAAQNLGAELEAERGRIERLQEETRSSEGQIAELQARIAALEERQRLIERLSEAQRELLAAGLARGAARRGAGGRRAALRAAGDPAAADRPRGQQLHLRGCRTRPRRQGRRAPAVESRPPRPSRPRVSTRCSRCRWCRTTRLWGASTSRRPS